MIERYRDHAANERTMLAWIRTALSMAVFGVVIERLDLYLRLSKIVKDGNAASQRYTEWLGVFLIAAGVFMIVTSLIRYFQISAAIEANHQSQAKARISDALLFGLLAAIVIVVMVFFVHAVGLLG